MVQFKQSVLVALTLLASTPVDVTSFTPSSSISNNGATFKTTQLEATKNNNNENRVVGGATAFVTGLVLATQVAFADASTLVDNSMPAVAFQEGKHSI